MRSDPLLHGLESGIALVAITPMTDGHEGHDDDEQARERNISRTAMMTPTDQHRSGP